MTFDLETLFMGRMYKLTNIVRLQSGVLIIETLKKNIYHYEAYKQIHS